MFLRCSSDNQYEVTATLTGCSDEQFTCRKDLTLFLKLKKYPTEKIIWVSAGKDFASRWNKDVTVLSTVGTKVMRSQLICVHTFETDFSLFVGTHVSGKYIPSMCDGGCLGWV